jgi:hypothetical protein
MDMNKDEGMRCLDIGKDFISRGNKERAEAFLRKAVRFYPTQEAKGKPKLQYVLCYGHQNWLACAFIVRTGA